MADNKRYITHEQENGSVMISEDVIADIIARAIIEVEGVEGLEMKPGFDIAELIGKNWGKGMKITISQDNELSISCNVIINYGQPVVSVAKNIQDAVTSAVESMTGVKVAVVDVNICGISRQ